MFELILIRHGETEFNRAGRFQGGHDSPLTEKGEDEARKLGEAMQNLACLTLPNHQKPSSPGSAVPAEATT